jgi:hypothetical protein
MSLSSLRSFSGAASFATTAFDTARTTFKAMADAAVPPAGSDGAGTDSAGERTPATSASAAERTPATSASAGERTPATSASAAERTPATPASAAERTPAAPTYAGTSGVQREAERSPGEKRTAGMRKGIALDAYA